MNRAGRAKSDGPPKLSIVLASQNAEGSVAACLREIEKQRSGQAIEVVVVDNSLDDTRRMVERDFPGVKLIPAPKDKLIPELWGIGVGQSEGEFVALSTTHFVPADDWITEIVKAHESGAAGIGGAIENSSAAGIVSWAVYFCRYSRYMLPFAESKTHDFAADNASYKRIELDRVKDAMKDGFWEVRVHEEMQRASMDLSLNPKIVVYHQTSFSFSDFISQRFQHGRKYGFDRSSTIPNWQRVVLILCSPLIPLIYLYRIATRVLARRRNIHKFALSLPILIIFLFSWSLGELRGYLERPAEG